MPSRSKGECGLLQEYQHFNEVTSNSGLGIMRFLCTTLGHVVFAAIHFPKPENGITCKRSFLYTKHTKGSVLLKVLLSFYSTKKHIEKVENF